MSAIMISWMQIFSAITVTYDSVSWPDMFADYSLFFGIINLDINFFMPALDCRLAVPFLDKFALHMATPIAIVVTVLVSKWAAACITVLMWRPKTKGQRRGNRWRLTKVAREAQTSYAYKIVLNILLLLYPSLTTRLFQVFRCTPIEVLDVEVLMLDYSVRCWEGDHWKYIVVAAGCIFVYAIGMPAFLLYQLWSHRNELHVYLEDIQDGTATDGETARFRLSNFYQSYEPPFWYWECVLLIYKCFMAGVLCVCKNGSPTQLLIAILFCIAYMLFCLKAGPYENDSADVLSFLTSLTMFLTLQTGYSKITFDQAVEPFDPSTERNYNPDYGYEFTETQLGTLLLAVNAIPPFYFCMAVLVEIKKTPTYVVDVICISFQTLSPLFRVCTLVCPRLAASLRKFKQRRQNERHVANERGGSTIVPRSDGQAGSRGLAKEKNGSHDLDDTNFTLPPAMAPTFYSGRRGTELLDTMTLHMQNHEMSLNRSISRRHMKSKRNTQLRLLERQRLRHSRALSRVRGFCYMSDDTRTKVVDEMVYQQKRKGDVVCRQGDSADSLFVVMNGACAVSTLSPGGRRSVRVGTVHQLQVFGDGSLLDRDEDRIQDATVLVETESAHLLVLKRDRYMELVESGVIDHSKFVAQIKMQKPQSESTQLPPPPPPPPERYGTSGIN
eukprot:g5297.t1